MRKTGLLGLLVTLFLSLCGCATTVSSGYAQGGQNVDGRSYQEARVDNQITAAVTTLLVQDKRVPAMDIDVTTYNGVVTLSGAVPDTSASRHAEELATSVPGVEQVINRLELRP